MKSITTSPSQVSGSSAEAESPRVKTPEERNFDSFRAMMAVQRFVQENAQLNPSLHFALFVNQATQRAVDFKDGERETSFQGLGGTLRETDSTEPAHGGVNPEDVAGEMRQLHSRMEALPTDMQQTEQAAIYFAEFVRIAPCCDGNKRTAWLLSQGMLVASHLSHWIQEAPDPDQIPTVLRVAESSGDLRNLANIFAESVGRFDMVSSAPFPHPFRKKTATPSMEEQAVHLPSPILSFPITECSDVREVLPLAV